jgi:serine protease Do
MSRNILKNSLILAAGVATLAGVSAAVVAAGESSGSKAPRHIVRVSDDEDDDAGRGYLGVSVQRLRKSLREAFDIPSDVQGLVISNVHDDTPADDAGLRNRDVILKLNGRAMDDEDEFTEAVRALEPGSEATLSIWRDGSTRDVTFTAAKRPRTWSFSWNSDDDDAPRAFAVPGTPRIPPVPPVPHAPRAPSLHHLRGMEHFGSGGRLGVEIRDLNEDIASYFGVAGDRGALIWKVNDDSPAEEAGLKAGDVIVEIEGETVRDTRDLREVLAGHDPGETVAVSYIRRGSNATARVELGGSDDPQVFFFSDGPGALRELRRQGAAGRGVDRSMEALQRDMENLQREIDRLRREMDRLKD